MTNADLSPSAFLAYCQANEVRPFTEHIRDPGEDGLQTAGGPVGATLCGKWIADGWDIELPVTLETLGRPMLADTTACPGCWAAARASLLVGSAAPAAVLADLAGRLARVDALTSEPDGYQSLPHNATVPVGPIRAALHAGNQGLTMPDKVQAALTEIAEDRRRYCEAVRDCTQERHEVSKLVAAIRRAAGWPDPGDEDGPPLGHLALAVLTTERDQLIEQVRAADIGPAADLVAELVRRADTATAAQAAAEAAAASANKYAREQAVNAERYRQLRSFVRRWLNHGVIPAEHEADVRQLCQLETP